MVTLSEEIKHQIETEIAGEVRLDDATRVIYSTDASIYQQTPLGVVFPRQESDLTAIVSICAAYGVPLLPRGAGSSLAGQTVGEALVIDFTRYLDGVESISVEESAAWVQPGVVLSSFNQKAAAYGLQFGPDPASADRATFGGIFGNNSTGAHSILYGMASDHLLEVDTVLADGNAARFKLESLAALANQAGQDSVYGQIVRTALRLREDAAEDIRAGWPKTWRNASGYALNYLIPWSGSKPPRWYAGNYPPEQPGSLNLAPLLVGSEGTLAVFARMKINLVPLSTEKVLAVLAFESIGDAADATPGLLALNPSAVELVPRAILARARTVPAYAARLSFLQGDPAALLLVEFSGDAPGDLLAKARQIENSLLVLDDPIQQRQMWEVRKVGLGLLMYMVGDAKPIPFVEDAAVPVENLGAFVKEFELILEAHGTRGDFYAHASAGCLHIRPIINLKTSDGIEKMHSISRQVVELALKYGGALSGEHADGLARGEWLEMVYGPEITAAFAELKQAADPAGILNPGKIVNPASQGENLRFGAEYKTKPWIPVQDFSNVAGLAGAIEMCNGAGVCRQASGAMCPTFQASREELHSTRGRANLLREMISGRTLLLDDAEQAAFESLSLCLACKGCKAECPSAVDVAKLKYEFLHHYYRKRRRPMSDYLFGYIGEVARFGRIFQWIANAFLGGGVGKTVLSWLGISRQRSFPLLKSRYMAERIAATTNVIEDVIFLSDPFSEYFTPELQGDAAKLLSRAGCRIRFLPVIGAGRTKLSKGLLPAARKHAQELLAALDEIDPSGTLPVVGVEPSEIAMLTDDLLSLIPGNSLVFSLAERSFSLEEFLLRSGPDGVARLNRLNLNGRGISVLLHGHCHQKAQSAHPDGLPSGVGATLALFLQTGAEIELIQSGCCGMAGAFGYEKDHVEMSIQVAELSLLPAIRAKQPRQIVAAPGASCRAQIEGLTDQVALHPVTILAELLPD